MRSLLTPWPNVIITLTLTELVPWAYERWKTTLTPCLRLTTFLVANPEKLRLNISNSKIKKLKITNFHTMNWPSCSLFKATQTTPSRKKSWGSSLVPEKHLQTICNFIKWKNTWARPYNHYLSKGKNPLELNMANFQCAKIWNKNAINASHVTIMKRASRQIHACTQRTRQ